MLPQGLGNVIFYIFGGTFPANKHEDNYAAVVLLCLNAKTSK